MIWQQSVAISNNGHPTLFLQTPGGIFEPFYGFYGGTLYAVVGGIVALVGTGHAYVVFVISIGVAAAIAYGGMWWLGRQLGLSRWLAHLPALVVVTGAYYLTDAYARGAWPELVGLSAVPLFLAGGASLLTRPWRAGPVALFLLAVVMLSGSHNITLFWSAILIGPAAIACWLLAGGSRPGLKRCLGVAAVALLGLGVNAWFLVLDLRHSTDTQAWAQFFDQTGYFSGTFYFDNLGNVLNPLRQTPSQSTTYGLAIAAPLGALLLGLLLPLLSGARLRRLGATLRGIWLVLIVAIVVLVILMVMPASWWLALGSPFIGIQFPYRLAGWLLIAIALLFAISLRSIGALSGARQTAALILLVLLVAVTVIQAAAQMYPSTRLDGHTNADVHPREAAFVGGPTTPPQTFYDPYSYADSSLPVIKTAPSRTILFQPPPAGATSATVALDFGRSGKPVATNIAGGPYVVRVSGAKLLGRTESGSLVVGPDGSGKGVAELTVTADGGTAQTLAASLSIASVIASLALIGAVGFRSRRTATRRDEATA